jgi:small-conductance mechanosensitive channel
MQTQNYNNHRRYVPLYTFVLTALILAILAGSVWYFYKSYDAHLNLWPAILIFGLSVVCIFFYIYARSFALRAQDRAIRAEETFRHFVLTGKPLDARLRLGQIIALRFADDAEFVSLAQRAAKENMTPDDIKKAIQNWRPDHYRV